MKAAALLLAGSLALAGCASSNSSGSASSSSGSGSSSQLKVGLAFDTGGRGDQGFNDSAYAGLQKAVKDNGGSFKDLAPNADASNRADLLTQLADGGYNPVIAVGFAYGDVIGDVAKQYPKTQFAIIDSSGLGADGTTPLGTGNVTGLLFAANQGSFLGGVAAALKTKTGQIGFVGGVQSPLIQAFEAGYVAGAKAAKPDIIVDTAYISPNGDFSGFSDPAKGKIVAQAQFDKGADIVYAAAGGSGIGVFQAALASNKLAIGVDQDQYNTVTDKTLQPVIMTSVLKRVDSAVETYIGQYVKGAVKGGTDVVNDLKTDGVGLAYSGGKIDDIKSQIEDYKQQIIDGQITVPTTP